MSTKIEWTDETWNPIVGCSRVSPGCDHCYAVGVVGRQMSPQHLGLTVRPDGGRQDWTGEVRVVEHKLDEPLRWRKPRRVFVNSLSDLFHPAVTDDTIARIFAVMALAPQHTFQVLTKRPQRMAKWFAYDFLGESQQVIVQEAVTALTRKLGWPRPVIFDGRMVNPEASTPHGRLADDPNYDRRAPLTWPLPNVWLGTSIESDRYAFRADHLRRTPAAVRFVSAEPLLGPLPSLDLTGIDWLIVGGESGPGARPMHPGWVRDLRDRCLAPITEGDEFWPLGRTSFFFKQWGDWLGFGPDQYGESITLAATTGALHKDWPGGRMSASVRVGKKNSGRELDGRTWDEFPAGPR